MSRTRRTFEKERTGFRQFRRHVLQDKNRDILTHMQQAIEEVFWTYDTALRENRFIVGGVIEIIVGTALRASGVSVRHKGTLESDVDLLFDDDEQAGYSIKAMLKSGQGTRLVNVMGSEPPSPDRWQVATLFLLSGGLGIIYADPLLPWWQRNINRCLRPTTDALQVSRECVERFATVHPEWVLPCSLPSGRERPTRSHPARTASADVATTILVHHPILFSYLPGLRIGEEIPGRS